jgi:hypothetical protein
VWACPGERLPGRRLIAGVTFTNPAESPVYPFYRLWIEDRQVRELHWGLVVLGQNGILLFQTNPGKAGLNHSHIFTWYEVGEHDGSAFLVMERLAGETFGERLEKGASPLAQVLAVATQITNALTAANRQGVIHCDLNLPSLQEHS